MRRALLLFDLVGTLVDEESDYRALDETMDAARYRFGIQDEAASLSGDFSLALMEILRGEEPSPSPSRSPSDWIPFEEAAKEVFAAVLEVRGIDAKPHDVAWFWSTFVDAQRRLVRAHPDAAASLECARRLGHRVIVVTDADPYFVRDIVPATGLSRLWDGVVTASEAGEPKPDPALFRLALKRAERSAIEAVMIGDSYERDVLGARAAGIGRAVLVDRHRARTVDDVPVISSLERLPAALARVVPSLN
jgi:FMN phosphatase YigB (HAD superfamily)